MLEIIVSFCIGLATSLVPTILVLKSKTKKQLEEVRLPLLKECDSYRTEIKNLEHQINSLKQDTEAQKGSTVEQISDALHTGSDLMENMSAGLGQIQEQVNSTSEPINNIHESSKSAQTMIQESRTSMENLTSSITHLNDLAALVEQLCTHMNQVNEKSQVIHNIANQANLLSLNAAIEAARAGDAGRGFGVVANDMNRLSELSAESAQEISKILSSGLKDIETITTEMTNKVEIFSNASETVLTCFNNMHEVVSQIGDISNLLSQDSASAVENVKSVTDQTQTNMESLTKVLSDVTGRISGNIISDVGPRQAADNLEDYEIIDVRKPHEFDDELGHINGATLYCLQDNFKENISGLDRETNYLFVCRSGGRSARAARMAQALGFKHVSNLAGGMLEWRKIFPKVG